MRQNTNLTNVLFANPLRAARSTDLDTYLYFNINIVPCFKRCQKKVDSTNPPGELSYKQHNATIICQAKSRSN